MIIGEIDHRRSARVERLSTMLLNAGISTHISERLRDPLWTKIIANLTSGSLSVLTCAASREIYGDTSLSQIVDNYWVSLC